MTTIELNGVVGWDITAADVRAALNQAGDRVHLRLNSPGGDVHEGVAIANALRAYRRDGGQVQATIVGVAASMATYIAMFADEVLAEDNAVWMVHNPWSLAMGDHRTMQKAANVLGSIRGVLARAYAAKTERPGQEILDEMDAESWYYGAEIVAAGYADLLVAAGDGPDSQPEAMALAQSAFQAMRGKLKEREADAAQLDRIAALLPPTAAPSASPPEKPMADLIDVADHPEAAETPPTPTADPVEIAAAVTQALAAERKRMADITRACAAAKRPQMAAAWIEDGTPIDRVREHLINALADDAGPEMRNAAEPAAPADFESLVQARQATGLTRAKAMRAVIGEHPALHRAWLARINAA